MKPNRYFSPGRFARLFRNDLLINQKMYFFTLVSLGIVLYAISYFLMRTSTKFQNDEYIGLFMLNLVVMGVIIGTAFPALSNPVKTGNYLLMPGSTLEKYLVQFFIRIVIFIPVALIIFWFTMHLAKASLVDPSSQIKDFHFNRLFENDAQQNQIIFLCIFSFGTFLFAGATYFKRYALAKTLITSAILVGSVYSMFVLFSYAFFPAEAHGFEIFLNRFQRINQDGNSYLVEDPSNLKLFWYAIGHLSWLFFLPIAYYKLNEKEV